MAGARRDDRVEGRDGAATEPAQPRVTTVGADSGDRVGSAPIDGMSRADPHGPRHAPLQDDAHRARPHDDSARAHPHDDPPRVRSHDDPPRVRSHDDPPRVRSHDDPPRVRSHDDPPRAPAHDDPPRAPAHYDHARTSSQDDAARAAPHEAQREPGGAAEAPALGRNPEVEHAMLPPHEPGSMDISTHEATYGAFVRLTIRAVLAILGVLILLALVNA